ENGSSIGELDGTHVQRTRSAVAFHLSHIRDLNCRPCQRGFTESSPRNSRCQRLATMMFNVVGRSAMHGANTKQITFSQPEVTEFGPAKAHGILENDPKHGREITTR